MTDSPYADPYSWFDAWFAEASRTVSPDPNAMTLATVNAEGRPSIRVVLLKSWDQQGMVFYTNRKSRKGRELTGFPHAALNFWWRELGWQIRIEGRVEALDAAESDAYFATRPRGSQIGAWASRQSEPLADRPTFEAQVDHFEAQFAGRDVPRPNHWGGFRVVPDRFEFWSAGEFRLHDRWVFERADGAWQAAQRLFP